MSQVSYNVAPRYTCGSPALANASTAAKVAHEEKQFIEHYLDGTYGPEKQAYAQQAGLGGIVERRHEIRDGWRVHDVITGRDFDRLLVSPKKLQLGDMVIEIPYQSDYTLVWTHGQPSTLPFHVLRMDIDGSVVAEDEMGRRLIMTKKATVRIERDVREP